MSADTEKTRAAMQQIQQQIDQLDMQLMSASPEQAAVIREQMNALKLRKAGMASLGSAFGNY